MCFSGPGKRVVVCDHAGVVRGERAQWSVFNGPPLGNTRGFEETTLYLPVSMSRNLPFNVNPLGETEGGEAKRYTSPAAPPGSTTHACASP